jgi:PIN domain nuclease of toxin-antitoxin system
VKVLLDTHVLLWWLRGDSALSDRARTLVSEPDTTAFVSSATAWEISIKRALGKLFLPDALFENFEEHLARAGFIGLPIAMGHATAAGAFPRHHGDPFDRMLIAQGMAEDLTIVTADSAFVRYDVRTFF